MLRFVSIMGCVFMILFSAGCAANQNRFDSLFIDTYLTALKDNLTAKVEKLETELYACRNPPEATPPEMEIFLETGGHHAPIKKMLMTADGEAIFTASQDKTIRRWDLRSQSSIRLYWAGFEDGINTMALSPDGSVLAVGTQRGDIKLIDSRQGTVKNVISGHPTSIRDVAFSPLGTMLAVASYSQIDLWHLYGTSSKHMKTIKGLDYPHAYNEVTLAFAPQDSILATGDSEGRIVLWSLPDMSPKVLSDTRSSVYVDTLSFSSSGNLLATPGKGRAIDLWDVSVGKLVRSIESKGASTFQFSEDGKYILGMPVFSRSASWGVSLDKGMRIIEIDNESLAFYKYRISDGESEQVFYSPKHRAVAAVINAAASRFAVANGANNVVTVKWGPNKETTAMNVNGGTTWAVGFSSDGKYLAWGHQFEFSFPFRKGRLKSRLRVDGLGPFNLSEVSDASSWMRESDQNGIYELRWDNKHKEHLLFADNKRLLEKTTFSPWGVYAFTPDGWLLRSDHSDNAFELYKLPDYELVAKFKGHLDDIKSLACSPDGRFVVSGSRDQTVRLWDLQAARSGHSKTVKPILNIFPTKDGKQWVAWTPDGYFGGTPGCENFLEYRIKVEDGKTSHSINPTAHIRKVHFPGVLHAILAGKPLEQVPAPAAILASITPPNVYIISPTPGTKFDGKSCTVSYRVADHGTGIKKIVVAINGKVVSEKNPPTENTAFIQEVKMPLDSAGAYKIAVSAMYDERSAQKASIQTVEVSRTKAAPVALSIKVMPPSGGERALEKVELGDSIRLAMKLSNPNRIDLKKLQVELMCGSKGRKLFSSQVDLEPNDDKQVEVLSKINVLKEDLVQRNGKDFFPVKLIVESKREPGAANVLMQNIPVYRGGIVRPEITFTYKNIPYYDQERLIVPRKNISLNVDGIVKSQNRLSC